jgi:predicted lysophospholipase L1 biosynthesis ABC-type transport system permease subunit
MNQYNDDIQHIRKMMERSSQFLSLSGLSGIGAGVVALLCVTAVFYVFQQHGINYFDGLANDYSSIVVRELFIIAILTIVSALGVVVYFTARKLKKNELPLYNSSTKKFILSLGLPLIVGGIFCIALTVHLQFYLVAPCMLIFYGLALINASKYTQDEIFWLGSCEVALGLIAAFFVGYGLVFWAIGFGILHILYGTIIHRKYK